MFDSAASKGSWADALGFEHQVHQLSLPAARAAAAAGARAGSVVEPATPHTDAAVQTDLSGPAESAGSTAAAPAATASEDAAAAQTQRQQDQQANSWQQVAVEAGAAAGEAGASSALLAAARHEILRLQELNRQLMQAHAEGELWVMFAGSLAAMRCWPTHCEAAVVATAAMADIDVLTSNCCAYLQGPDSGTCH